MRMQIWQRQQCQTIRINTEVSSVKYRGKKRVFVFKNWPLTIPCITSTILRINNYKHSLHHDEKTITIPGFYGVFDHKIVFILFLKCEQ
jgi:hypothetical protein